MKISRIIIKKFRSIEKADIWIDSINAVVGQNNSGKSCLLRALNAFFNYELEKEAFDISSHAYTATSVSKIEIHFDGIDLASFPHKYLVRDKLQLEVTFQLTKTGCTRTLKYKKTGKWVADDSVLKEVKKHIEFVLIPPNRDAYALDMVEHSILNMLVEEKMEKATGSRDNYSVKFRIAIDYLESHALKDIARDAKREFPVTKKIDLKVAYKKEIGYQQFLNDVGVFVKESGQEHSLNECGSGIQSLTIIALYNLLAKEKDENIIIGLEEPETNLHPQAQKEMIEYFKDLVEESSISQFFFTTHSSQMIDAVDHTDVILFRKIDDINRGFKTTASRLSKTFYDDHGLDEFKYYQFHRYKNSDFFFSSYVVVTESKNEIEMIHRMAGKIGKNFDVNGLSYMSIDGVGNSRYAIHLLNDLGIPYLLIVDKDFFCPYLEDSFERSLDASGLPTYKKSFDDQEMIETLIPNQADRLRVLTHINNNHTALLDLLEPYNIVCMRYTLDLDLVAVPTARQYYYQKLRIPAADQNIKELSVNNKKAIKKIENMSYVFDHLNTNNWPYSYSRIKNLLVSIARELTA